MGFLKTPKIMTCDSDKKRRLLKVNEHFTVGV